MCECERMLWMMFAGDFKSGKMWRRRSSELVGGVGLSAVTPPCNGTLRHHTTLAARKQTDVSRQTIEKYTEKNTYTCLCANSITTIIAENWKGR